MSQTLRRVAQRACALFTRGPGSLTASAPAAVLEEQVRFLTVTCTSLSALCKLGEGGRDSDYLAVAVATTTEQLVDLLTILPESVTLSPEVLRMLVKVGQQSFSYVPTHAVQQLLKGVDHRVSPVTLSLWGGHQQLQCLHIIAKVNAGHSPHERFHASGTESSAKGGQPATVPYSMVEGLLVCLQRELGRLSEAEVATLLWCLATLRLQQAGPLWPAVCKRCQFLLRRMNAVSRATLLHALLLSESDTSCAAQQELMAALLASTGPRNAGNARVYHEIQAGLGDEERELSQEGGAGASTGRDFASSLVLGMDAVEGGSLEDGSVSSTEALSGRLLRAAHTLPTDILVSLLVTRMPVGGSVALADGSQDVNLLLSELTKRRQRTPQQAVSVLQDAVLPQLPLSLAPSTGSSLSRPQGGEAGVVHANGEGMPELTYTERQLRSLGLSAVGALVQTKPDALPTPQVAALCLGRVLLLQGPVTDYPTGSPPESTPTTPEHFLVLNRAQVVELWEYLSTLLRALMRSTRETFGVMDGATAYAAAVLCDIVAQHGPVACGDDGASSSLWEAAQTTVSKAAAVIGEAPESWRRRSVQELFEHASMVVTMACRSPLPVVSSSLLAPASSVAPDSRSAGVAEKLLRRSVSALSEADRLPLRVITRTLATLEAGNNQRAVQYATGVTSALTALSKRLVLLLEAPDICLSRETLLTEVGTLLTSSHAPPQYSAAPLAHHTDRSELALPPSDFSVMDALLDLYVRLVQSENARASGVVAHQHAATLVRCLTQRARTGPAALERGFMVLSTRRFGQWESFLKTVQLPPDALVALIHLAEELLRHTTRGARSATLSQSPAATSAVASSILAALLEHILPLNVSDGSAGAGAVAQCMDLRTLTDVASLLASPTCTELGLTAALAKAVTQQAVRIMSATCTPPQERALLIAHFVRANVDVSEELVQALHRH